MPSPLRPELYQRLRARLGAVTIAHAGEAFQGNVTWDPVKKRFQLQAIWSGEYYVTNCPYCSDTRQRLWINHRWGLYVPELKSDNLWLAVCYNENCLSEPGKALELKHLVFNDFLNGKQPDPVLRGSVLSADTIRPARLPGLFHRLDHLPAEHPACVYLRQRGYDPVGLGQDLYVGYCQIADPCFRPAQGRIIIPIFCNGVLVGWQARYIGEPPSRTVPKYFTMPGMPRRQLLYNYDVARCFSDVIVCEGVMDVWRFGPEAVALFGKTASAQQSQLLGAHWRDGVLVVLLDGDAGADAQKIAEAPEIRNRDKVVVTLPADKDPGDYSTFLLRELVVQTARQEHFYLGLRELDVRTYRWVQPLASSS